MIARNSSFSYKGQSPDIRQVGKELGVRYVLEGSVRKSANRIRVTGQLIDALTGQHLWAEKYDRVLADIFEVQEELTRGIVSTIAPHIDEAERNKVQRRRPGHLGAYERVVSAWAKARAAYMHSDVALRNDALREAEAALAIDPRSTQALQIIAFVHWQHFTLGTGADRTAEWQAGMAAATQAIEQDRHDSVSYQFKAFLLGMASDGQLVGEALRTAQRAYELNPNSGYALSALAWCELISGLMDGAIGHVHQALRMNPRDPMRYIFYQQLTMACVCTGDYANGVEYALLGLADAPDVPQLHGMLAMSHVGLGDIANAKRAFDTAHSARAHLGGARAWPVASSSGSPNICAERPPSCASPPPLRIQARRTQCAKRPSTDSYRRSPAGAVRRICCLCRHDDEGRQGSLSTVLSARNGGTSKVVERLLNLARGSPDRRTWNCEWPVRRLASPTC